eukprot:g1295.t1
MVADDDAELTQEVLELSLPRLAYGGRVAMFGHHLQPLAALQGAWRANGSFVDVRLTQLFTREFQALPSRTHPFMVAEAQLCEGFILCASKAAAPEPRNDEPPVSQRTMSARAKRQPMLLIHLDINKTVIQSDSIQMKSIEEGIREGIAELFWGTLRQADSVTPQDFYGLRCNWASKDGKDCKNSTDAICWITSCQHVLCDEHAKLAFASGDSCPICGYEAAKVIKANLSREGRAQARKGLLPGLTPSEIMDSAARNIEFWVRQKALECMQRKKCRVQMEKRSEEMSKSAEEQIQVYQRKCQQLEEEQVALQKKLDDLESDRNSVQLKIQALQRDSQPHRGRTAAATAMGEVQATRRLRWPRMLASLLFLKVVGETFFCGGVRGRLGLSRSARKMVVRAETDAEEGVFARGFGWVEVASQYLFAAAMPATINVRPDGVGVITMDSPPVNSLGTELVKAIVVTGKGNMFCGGAEITEFAIMVAMGPEKMKENNPVAALSEMMDMIDASPKTVVAALNGPALGGGGEVSLACHYRVASAKSSVGFPEVKLGLLPGAQGTQRLPRVAPLPTAMSMILQGNPLNAQAAKKNGIVDLVASKDLIEEAAEWALSHPPAPISKREVHKTNRFMVAAGGLEQGLNTAVNAAPLMIAPRSIIKCFEAACSGKPFRDGLKVEQEEFTKLVFSVESAALRHLFLSERLAQKVPGVDEKPLPLNKIGILGAGLMGGGIAMCFIQKGIPVVLKDAKQEWLDGGVKKIDSLWAGRLKKGKLSKDKYNQYHSLLKPTLDFADFKDVDMVIEAVPEIMDLKKLDRATNKATNGCCDQSPRKQCFLDIEKNTKPDCLICTNTSGLNIDDIAAVLKDPSRVMGTHFFSPANVMQLLENVRTSKSSIKTLSTGMQMAKIISKKAVMVGNCDGFVGNRMLAPYAGEAKMVGEEGATIEQIDKACTKFGMAMGPMALGDLVGLELFWKQRQAAGDMKKQTKTYYGPYELTDWLCEKGRFGLKTPDPSIKANGRGVFIHQGRDKYVDPEEIRKTKGITARAVSDEEIVERLFFTMINEGFKILEEGYVARSSDIDIVYIYGYGFPPSKGGPMFFAENYVGFQKSFGCSDGVGFPILERLKVYGAQAKERFTKNPHYLPIDYFEPSKLLEACAQKQGTKVFPGQTLIDVTR